MIILKQEEKAMLKKLFNRMSFFELLETLPDILKELDEEHEGLNVFQTDIERIEKTMNFIERERIGY
jgi:hypothetical protein